jgi:hypothetical protein
MFNANFDWRHMRLLLQAPFPKKDSISWHFFGLPTVRPIDLSFLHAVYLLRCAFRSKQGNGPRFIRPVGDILKPDGISKRSAFHNLEGTFIVTGHCRPNREVCPTLDKVFCHGHTAVGQLCHGMKNGSLSPDTGVID